MLQKYTILKRFYHNFTFSLLIVLFGFLSLVSCKNNSDSQTEEQTSIAQENPAAENEENTQTILFFGNSLTAGMGLDSEESFPALIQDRIDSLELDYNVINAGLSGETTAAGKNRIEWVMNQDVDIFVLELGANDGLRGVPVSETRKNLQDIMDHVRSENPDIRIILAGMQMPPNLGQEYTSDFKDLFPDLAAQNDVELIPFLLEGVAGDPELNQGDGIHPTAEGQKIVADNVWTILKPMLGVKEPSS